MTPALADAVRWPINADEVRVRMSDRAVSRMATVTRRLWRTVADQPAGSRMRRWLLTRVFSSGWAAIDSKDWDYVEAFYDPDVVVETSGEGAIFDWGTSHGWAETRTRLEQTYEVLTGDHRPLEAIDFGGPFVGVLLEATLAGASSGIETSREMTILYEIGDEGRVVRQWTSTEPEKIDAVLRSESPDP